MNVSARALVSGCCVALCTVNPGLALADQVPPELSQRFAELARRAEAALANSGPGAAIPIYEEGLAATPEGYGRLNLRLGQLHQQLGNTAEAAAHYRTCDRDSRVETIDRELICQDGLQAMTAPVELQGLPPGGRVLVLEPMAFAGPFESGARLPLGPARLLVEAPLTSRRESTVKVVAPSLVWPVLIGTPYTEEENAQANAAPATQVTGTSGASARGSGRWPALVTGGVGLLLAGAGLAVGLTNRGELEDIRARQRSGDCGAGHCAGDLAGAESSGTLADGLMFGGIGVAAVGVGLWFLLD